MRSRKSWAASARPSDILPPNQRFTKSDHFTPGNMLQEAVRIFVIIDPGGEVRDLELHRDAHRQQTDRRGALGGIIVRCAIKRGRVAAGHGNLFLGMGNSPKTTCSQSMPRQVNNRRQRFGFVRWDSDRPRPPARAISDARRVPRSLWAGRKCSNTPCSPVLMNTTQVDRSSTATWLQISQGSHWTKSW